MPRELTARDVVRLVDGERVPGIDEDHEVVRQLRQGAGGVAGKVAFLVARKYGFLIVNHRWFEAADDIRQLRLAWEWWCTAATHPRIELVLPKGIETADIRCDVSTTGQDWTLGSFLAVGMVLERVDAAASDGGWMFTRDELELDGLPREAAWTVAQELVQIATPRGGEVRP